METPVVNNFAENDEPDEYTIVIDIGQGTTKVGFAGEEKPRAVFPTVTGKPKYKQMMAGVQTQEIYVGDDTTKMRGVLKLDYPIDRGNVMDWEQYFAILNHIFYDVLRIDSKKCNVIYLVSPLIAPETYQYFARVLFETHQVKTVAIIDTASTAAFSVGETTALSVEIGTGLTHITPVMNGQLYKPSIQRLNLAGIDIEDYLISLLSQYGITQKREIIKEIKEKACKISLNPEIESQDGSIIKFLLPDGESLKISNYVATYAGEVLFSPNLLGYNYANIPQAIINAIRVVDPYYWRPLLKKIVFSGGTSYFKGLKERLEQEVERLLPQLGPLPDPVIELEESPEHEPNIDLEKPKKLVQITTETKKRDNCSHCGELIDLTKSEFCPFCGGKIKQKQIEILGAAQQKFPDVCLKCGKKLEGDSPFCPFCGSKLEVKLIEDKIGRKEKKLIKQTAASEKDLLDLAKEIEDEYGSADEFDEIEEITPDVVKESPSHSDPNKIVNVILSDDRDLASYKGAAILGVLPTFKDFMVNYQSFSQDANLVWVDFAKIVNRF